MKSKKIIYIGVLLFFFTNIILAAITQDLSQKDLVMSRKYMAFDQMASDSNFVKINSSLKFFEQGIDTLFKIQKPYKEILYYYDGIQYTSQKRFCKMIVYRYNHDILEKVVKRFPHNEVNFVDSLFYVKYELNKKYKRNDIVMNKVHHLLELDNEIDTITAFYSQFTTIPLATNFNYLVIRKDTKGDAVVCLSSRYGDVFFKDGLSNYPKLLLKNWWLSLD